MSKRTENIRRITIYAIIFVLASWVHHQFADNPNTSSLLIGYLAVSVFSGLRTIDYIISYLHLDFLNFYGILAIIYLFIKIIAAAFIGVITVPIDLAISLYHIIKYRETDEVAN